MGVTEPRNKKARMRKASLVVPEEMEREKGGKRKRNKSISSKKGYKKGKKTANK